MKVGECSSPTPLRSRERVAPEVSGDSDVITAITFFRRGGPLLASSTSHPSSLSLPPLSLSLTLSPPPLVHFRSAFSFKLFLFFPLQLL